MKLWFEQMIWTVWKGGPNDQVLWKCLRHKSLEGKLQCSWGSMKQRAGKDPECQGSRGKGVASPPWLSDTSCCEALGSLYCLSPGTSLSSHRVCQDWGNCRRGVWGGHAVRARCTWPHLPRSSLKVAKLTLRSPFLKTPTSVTGSLPQTPAITQLPQSIR